MAQGFWSAVQPWPLIGVHAVLLPDGRVLTFGTATNGDQGIHKTYDIWDPKTGLHQTLTDAIVTDEFCSATALDPVTGNVIIIGGDGRQQGKLNLGVTDVNTFDYRTSSNVASPEGHLSLARWYPSLISIGGGQFIALGGENGTGKFDNGPQSGIGVGTPELYTPGSGWKQLPGAFSGDIALHWYYPRAWLSSSGTIFGYSTGDFGANAGQVFSINPTGQGSIAVLGQTPFESLAFSAAVMFAPDRILTIDGAGNSWIVDISGAAPTFVQTGNMGGTRSWANLTNLADGTVLMTGGSAKPIPQYSVDVAIQTNNAEIWNPDTGQWTNDASAAIGRFYHSSTLLLADGTVLSTGGGAPGPANNLNAEIYTPGYLLNPDGSLRTDRPVITSAPNSLEQGQTFWIYLDNADVIKKLELIKFGASTHSFDAEQRAFKLDFIHINATTLQVNLPYNANLVTDGYYLLFADNNNGTPSVAATIKIGAAGIDVYSPELNTTLTTGGTTNHKIDSRTYTLTADSPGQTGSLMSDQRVDLTHNFSISFNVLMGNTINPGDGMAFVLHNDPAGKATIGTGLGGLGALGIRNGLAIEFDTFHNPERGDIAQQHTDIATTDPNAPTYRVTKQVGLNLSDGAAHNITVVWNAATQNLAYSYDGVQIATLSKDLVNTYFGGSRYVYFGFTGATGGASEPNQIQLNWLSAKFEPNGAGGGIVGHPSDGSIFDVSTVGQHVVGNGSTLYDNSTHILTLTQNLHGQAGSAFFANKVDLTHDFNFNFDINIGPNQPAEGLTFLLQNDPNGVHALGGNRADLGAVGIQNGLAITFDTYQNADAPRYDPAYNHSNIQRTATPGAYLTPTANLGNITDGGWHQVAVTWDSQAHVLRYWVDGQLDGTLTGDIATQYLANQSTAYVGFTAATGGVFGTQQVRVGAVDAYFAGTSANYANIQNPIALSNGATVNGSARYDSVAHNFVLTPNKGFQAGSAMLGQRIDVSYDFQVSFNAFFGNGADGLAFVLQNDTQGANAVGSLAANLGAVGIKNGLAIALDAFQNTELNDMPGGHSSYLNTALSLAQSRISDQVKLGTGNVADANWHNVLVSWDAVTQTMTYWVDGIQGLTLKQNIVAKYLGGSQFAYLGFTGATGGVATVQEVHLNSLTATLEATPAGPAGHTNDGSILDVSALGHYVVGNGSTLYDTTSNVLTLTSDLHWQAGSAFFADKVDLTHDFNFNFTLYFDASHPADGLAFVLQNDPNGVHALGGNAGNLGAIGIQNGLAIEFDTFQNAASADPGYAHTNFISTGQGGANLTHATPIAGFTDGSWHQVGVTWDSQAHVLRYWVDGHLGGSLGGDIATQYLGSQSTAYVGFTAATGGATSSQQIQVNNADAFFTGVSANYPSIQDPIAVSNSANLNGAASYDGVAHNFILTPNQGFSAGSAMLSQRIDLSYNFQVSFNALFGTNGARGDGIAFVLENDPRGAHAVGGNAGNLGAVGIRNGLAIGLDTFPNTEIGDIAADHSSYFNTTQPLAQSRISQQDPIGGGNVNDGNWHNVFVSWNAVNQILAFWVDGVQQHSLKDSIATKYLGGSQYAYLGFTAATGGAKAVQEVHLDSLTATFESPAHAASTLTSHDLHV